MSDELIRMTNRFSPGDIRILDRIKDAGSYTSRNAVILALIRKCGTQYANRLEAAFREVTFDTTSVTNDAYLTSDDTNLTPLDSTNLTSDDTTSVTNDATSTLDWESLIGNA